MELEEEEEVEVARSLDSPWRTRHSWRLMLPQGVLCSPSPKSSRNAGEADSVAWTDSIEAAETEGQVPWRRQGFSI